jgi:hypothetical protein
MAARHGCARSLVAPDFPACHPPSTTPWAASGSRVGTGTHVAHASASPRRCAPASIAWRVASSIAVTPASKSPDRNRRTPHSCPIVQYQRVEEQELSKLTRADSKSPLGVQAASVMAGTQVGSTRARSRRTRARRRGFRAPVRPARSIRTEGPANIRATRAVSAAPVSAATRVGWEPTTGATVRLRKAGWSCLDASRKPAHLVVRQARW